MHYSQARYILALCRQNRLNAKLILLPGNLYGLNISSPVHHLRTACFTTALDWVDKRICS